MKCVTCLQVLSFLKILSYICGLILCRSISLPLLLSPFFPSCPLSDYYLTLTLVKPFLSLSFTSSSVVWFLISHWPPPSPRPPLSAGLLHIKLSERVVVGKDGNLYFAHLTPEDSRNDYTCNVQYLATRTILAKEPITLTVTPCKSHLHSPKNGEWYHCNPTDILNF